jgi:hypothetical protein
MPSYCDKGGAPETFAPLRQRPFADRFKLRFVILNLFQDNAPPLFVIPKQVRDDDNIGKDIP